MVDTPYGPMPGCKECGVISLGGHVCEHGVTPAITAEVTVTMPISKETYNLLTNPEEEEDATGQR